MLSKIRKKITLDLCTVASEECNSLEDESLNMGTIHQDLIVLAYRYAPLKELRKLIVEGKQMIKENEGVN
tara:strand:+ start:124 stop:333 length:210 start_codon:yes stop_codon:yes gene_type:complete